MSAPRTHTQHDTPFGYGQLCWDCHALECAASILCISSLVWHWCRVWERRVTSHWCALMPIIAVAQIHACTSHIRLTCILSLASHARALHSIVEYKIPNRHIIHRLARVVRSEVCVCVCFVDATVQHGCNYAIHRQHAISAPVHAVNVLCKQTLIVICFSYRIF